MKKNRNALVRAPRVAGGELGRPRELRPEENPVAVYLASLGKDSRPAMISGLKVIANTISKGAGVYQLPWHELRFKHTQALRAVLVEQFAPRTVNRMLSSVRGVLKAAWRLNQITTDDYMKAIDVKHENVRDLPPAGRFVTKEEVGELLQAAGRQAEPLCFRDQAIVIALYAGGLRRQEAASANIEDYDPKEGALQVVRGKRGKYRQTYIVDGYRGWIEPWVNYQRKRTGPSGPLFVRIRKNGAVTDGRITRGGIDTALDTVREAAKLKDFAPHDLRRSFATELLDAGADLLMVQELMGHADVKTTKLYDRRGEAGKKKAIAKFPVVLSYDDFKAINSYGKDGR